MTPRTPLLSKSPLAFQLLVILVCVVSGLPWGRAEEHEGRDREAGGRKAEESRRRPPKTSSFVVLGYNDLGMHCMNQDFSQLCILPPYNTLHAQVIERGREEPRIISTASKGVSVRYSIPGNTVSTTKTNFWAYARPLFGVTLQPNIGLTGNGLSGVMRPTGENDWAVTGIPITPLDDHHALNPYPLAKIDVVVNGTTAGTTSAVVPVSWEISCNLCHGRRTGNVDDSILRAHDRAHGTKLVDSKPVLCARCHADAALGARGLVGVKSLSHAMHGSHAARMGSVSSMGNTCYACHPGFQTQCQRDVHLAKGITCVNCHGDMATVANPLRRPWVDEPTCQSCHQQRRPDFQFEEPGRLFKDSRGHHGVHCAACHGSPHAITPTITAPDNVQAVMHQGFTGPIRKCSVCHAKQPDDDFEHRLDEMEDD